MNWSNYQRDIFRFIEEEKDNAIITAVAGSGKTTTVIEALNHVNTTDAVFMAFNKSIATTMQSRLPAGIEAKTLHAFGRSQIVNSLGYVKVQKDRNREILKDLLDPDDNDDLTYNTLKTVSHVKNQLITVQEASLLTDATTADLPQIMIYAQAILDQSDKTPNVIDFDDMIYIPATGKHGVKINPITFMALDEVQDLNPAQIEMVLKASSGNRIVSVGDPRQSIYAFRGADSEAMTRVQIATNAKSLPLSISYRCPLSVIKLAQELVPEIEASPNAPDGLVNNISATSLINNLKPDDLVLCRTNAPLIRLAYKLVKDQTPFKMNGQEFGDRIISLFRRAKKEVGDDLAEAREWIITDLRIKQDQYNGAEIFSDQIEIVEILCEDCKTISEVISLINTVFNPKNKGVTLSTVHRAKGEEADHVFILHPELMPHPKAKSEADVLQENNIKYVAITRAKKELTWVS